MRNTFRPSKKKPVSKSTYRGQTSKPVLAITLGDPAGIGPEIVLKSLANPSVNRACRPLVVGDAQCLSLVNRGVNLKIRPVLNPAQARYRYGVVDVLHLPNPEFRNVKPGRPNKLTGALSFAAVKSSTELALAHLADGVVHAPISKAAWHSAGIHFSGHTEVLSALCGKCPVAMAIVSEPLRTVLVTRHIPHKDVSSRLKKSEIINAIAQAALWLKKIGISRPRIGVCALNPHAGENGLLGWEEIRVIGPAVKRARKISSVRLLGPLPADAAYKAHKNGLVDCLITMYHDQSLIPLKLFNADKLVNVTLGLPFPRTSPGHGTAFDIAGKNRANPLPMTEAILTAARLCRG